MHCFLNFIKFFHIFSRQVKKLTLMDLPKHLYIMVIYIIMLYKICWDHRVAWSILWALGAWDSGSNPGGPTLYLPDLAQFGRALDCRSKCCWFKSGSRDFIIIHYFIIKIFLWKFQIIKIALFQCFIRNIYI